MCLWATKLWSLHPSLSPSVDQSAMPSGSVMVLTVLKSSIFVFLFLPFCTTYSGQWIRRIPFPAKVLLTLLPHSGGQPHVSLHSQIGSVEFCKSPPLVCAEHTSHVTRDSRIVGESRRVNFLTVCFLTLHTSTSLTIGVTRTIASTTQTYLWT
jgi:hypothetical protein